MFKRHFKETILLALPMIVGQIGQLSMSIADNVMVGRVGTDALAAAAIGNALFMLVMVVGFGISMAITPLTAMAAGARRDTDCGVILRQGLIVNLLSGVLLCVVTLVGAESIRFFHQPETIVEPAILYMQVLGFSMLPLMLFQSFRQFAEGVSFLKPAMVITLLANLVNIAVNWIFIYGNLGAPALGVIGAGLATFFSRTFMALSLMWVIMTAPSLKRFDPSLRYRKIDILLMKTLLKIGIPGACQYFFEVSAFTASAVIVGWMGTQALAAHQIALNLASISFMVAMGIAGAGTIRVSHALGRDSARDVRTAGFSAVLLCAGFMATSGLVFVLFRESLPMFYVSDMEVTKMAASLLVIVAFFQISDGTQSVGLGILRGITDMKIPTLITLTAYWVIGLPSGYVLAFHFDLGIYGVWYGLLIGLTASALLMMLRFNVKTKK
ncbi:MAG: MATE family efflux transporter [Proteobacteria bacterium]|nr:MATE family efflux transporter [Desulfobacula sp.]MBU3953891.1 MATE family efflux transporter [Pseudomonadota bacterium]MBU4132428.1 MATE family efflux transporter [Pseudomonadota bacterium]